MKQDIPTFKVIKRGFLLGVGLYIAFNVCSVVVGGLMSLIMGL